MRSRSTFFFVRSLCTPLQPKLWKDWDFRRNSRKQWSGLTGPGSIFEFGGTFFDWEKFPSITPNLVCVHGCWGKRESTQRTLVVKVCLSNLSANGINIWLWAGGWGWKRGKLVGLSGDKMWKGTFPFSNIVGGVRALCSSMAIFCTNSLCAQHFAIGEACWMVGKFVKNFEVDAFNPFSECRLNLPLC